MINVIQIKHASIAVHDAEACSYLNDLINLSDEFIIPNALDADSFRSLEHKINLEISNSALGLKLIWHREGEKPLNFSLDFVKVAKQVRSFPAPKQGAFNQALGKKSKTIIDATGGWGGDALLMFLQGYHVIIIERLPIMAVLLSDAFDRLTQTLCNSIGIGDNQLVAPEVLCGDALTVLKQNKFSADCVYLDPMFPPKRKKSAATNKHMQLLQWLAGTDDDASDLAAYAAQQYPRLTVKRPDYAQPLLAKPNVQFSSKLVHYDVYL